MLLIIIMIAIGSVAIGYLVGSNMHPDSTALLHQLRSDLRAVLLSRQNWTSREILAKLASAVNDLTESTVHDLEKRQATQEKSLLSKHLIPPRTNVLARRPVKRGGHATTI